MVYRVGQRVKKEWGEAGPYVMIAIITIILFMTQLENIIGGFKW